MTANQPTKIFGIKNCDSVKKACRWLKEYSVDFHFHDFRKDGLEEAKVSQWLDQAPAELLLNKRGTTWRKLDSQTQEKAQGDELSSLLAEQPTLIKRPVLEHNGEVVVGFSAERYAELFQS